jgi:hypothetical protein
MAFKVGDRVTKGALKGTVEGIFNTFLWVLVDGQSTPTTVPDDGSVALEVPLVFEVGHSYSFPGDAVIFRIVYKIDEDHFIAWFQPPQGGFQVTLVAPAQRAQVVEVA